jgi:hypothetical protein
MNLEKSSIAGDFIAKYSAEYDQDFWEKQYGQAKENPLDKLKKTTLSRLERTKHMQFLARKYGIIDEIKSFAALESELKKVNAERAKIKKETGILYGPVQYTFDVYYNIKNTELEYKLKKEMMDLERSWVSDDQARAYYDKMKETVFNLGHQLRYYQVRLPAKLLDPRSTEKIRAILLGQNEIDKDAFESLPSDLSNKIRISKHQQQTNEWTQDERYNKTMKILGNLDVGGASDPIHESEDAVFYKLIEKKHLGSSPYDKAKYGIKRDMYEEKIDSLLENSSQHVKTKINRKLYNSLPVVN